MSMIFPIGQPVTIFWVRLVQSDSKQCSHLIVNIRPTTLPCTAAAITYLTQKCPSHDDETSTQPWQFRSLFLIYDDNKLGWIIHDNLRLNCNYHNLLFQLFRFVQKQHTTHVWQLVNYQNQQFHGRFKSCRTQLLRNKWNPRGHCLHAYIRPLSVSYVCIYQVRQFRVIMTLNNFFLGFPTID